MDMVDALDIGMRGDGDGVEAAHLAHLDEGGLELPERLHVGRRPHVLVAVEDREAVDVLHRHDRFANRPSSQARAARFCDSTA